MNVSEAARRLREQYDAGKRVGKATTAIHLFAVQHADSLSRLRIAEVLKQAGLPASYVTEIHKGIKLAEYVQVTRSFP